MIPKLCTSTKEVPANETGPLKQKGEQSIKKKLWHF